MLPRLLASSATTAVPTATKTLRNVRHAIPTYLIRGN